MEEQKLKKKYEDVANLHIQGIKDGFLPTLGKNFLTLMYRCIDEADHAILLTDYDNNILRGFVVGTLGKTSTYKLMLRYPLRLFFVLFQVLYSPKKLFKVMNIISHMSGVDRRKYPKEELLTIIVDNRFKRMGIANNLYNQLIQFFKNNKINNFSIVVGKQLKANSFYKEMGATIAGEIEVHDGIKSYIYIQKIDI